uniref:separase n=1 Tax=Gadus morhua TaxID=8049 RepID=A0A8C4YU82_GADMO
IYVRGGAGTQGRTICDRIIRACNHQLGVGPPCLEHISSLVRLVEAALCGYDASGANMAQRSPLYMEKIVFHIVKKLSSLGAQGPCSHLGGLLRSRLLPPQQTEDYTGLVRTCFAVLWNGLAAAKDDTTLNPKDRLNGQMQALQFLLLLDSSGTAPLSCSKGAEDAFATFQKARGTLTTDDGSFVLRETLSFFHGCCLPFRLAVQSSRRCGRLERALDWVMVWLKALGPAVLAQMAEPVSLWVRTKAEAARAGEEDLRLRTLRDGFGPDLPDEDVLLGLLTEELRAYRELPADTSQERYNTLCDLLELCHEDSAHPHLRAVYLGEMARVVCFQDFKEQTDCLAVDFTHEALRLLEEEPETADNAARLKDDKAQVLLWLYICTLEKNLQTVGATGSRSEMSPRSKSLADVKFECYTLSRSTDVYVVSSCPSDWFRPSLTSKAPVHERSSPSTQTVCVPLCHQPLKALEAYQLSLDLARRLDDAKGCAGSLCHSARLLLDLGCPELAEVGRRGDELRGVPFLCEVLQEVNEQRQSKSWYLLRAQALQACSSYLGLDLHSHWLLVVCVSGFKSADTAMHGALKLLASLLVTLVGNGLYMSISGTSETRFVDQGENLSLKWLVLSELQGCSLKMVEVRSRSGSVHDAKLLLLEALEMSAKLQAVSQYVGLDSRVSSRPLDVAPPEQKMDVKIKPRKGRPAAKAPAPIPSPDEDYSGLLSTRWFTKETAEQDQGSSPPLKAQPRRWLSSLAHAAGCRCPCCGTPSLGRVTARWAVAQADLALLLEPSDGRVSRILHRTALSRCRSVTEKLSAQLAALFPSAGPAEPGLMLDVVGRTYLSMALAGLGPRLDPVQDVWDVMEAGLAFVSVNPSPVLRPARAGLMATKAMASLLTLAGKRNCSPEELFSSAWTWNPPRDTKRSKTSALLPSVKVPTVVCTPVPRPRAGAPRGPARASTRTPFQVYEEGSPDQEKPQPVPGAPRRTKKSRFKVDFSDESDAEEVEPKAKAAVPKKRATAAASKAAGRGRRPLAGGAEGEPEKMRTIEEEMAAAGLDLSMEVLRGSDAEDNAAANADLEVLRRDRCGDLERVSRSTLLSRPGPLMGGLPANLAPSDALPEDLSLESVQSLLRTAWLSLQHLPSPGLYPALCGLLALSLGQLDAPAAAMLHTHSLGVAHRHHTLRHLASRLKKLKKGSNELTERLASLRLEESLEPPLEGRLEQLEQLFGFPAACPETFPRQQSQDFLQQVERLPSGLTVCVLSLVGVRPGEVGESLLLTRLERGAAPITVHIPSSGPQVRKLSGGVSGLVQEMDRIHAEQKVVSWFSEKNRWWEGRRGLDARLKVRTLSLSHTLKLSLSPGPPPPLRPSPTGLFTRRSVRRGVEAVTMTTISSLFQHLQKLPWECMLCLRPRSVTRMPSLHSLLGACLQREWDPRCILEQGVDPKQVFYVLNPDANLSNTEDRFKDLFSSQRDWQGVCGAVPDSDQLQEAVATKDLYIYVGHGAGVRYLDARSLLKQDLRAAALLFGCSSAALAVRGDLEGAGIILHYLTAGCPLVLGTLWDVTDRDIDRFTTALLESWLSAGSGAPLLDYMGPARQATQLRHLVGAAPVVYGLPVHLK